MYILIKTVVNVFLSLILLKSILLDFKFSSQNKKYIYQYDLICYRLIDKIFKSFKIALFIAYLLELYTRKLSLKDLNLT